MFYRCDRGRSSRRSRPTSEARSRDAQRGPATQPPFRQALRGTLGPERRGLVAQRVFKTRTVVQPTARSVRLRRRSVDRVAAACPLLASAGVALGARRLLGGHERWTMIRMKELPRVPRRLSPCRARARRELSSGLPRGWSRPCQPRGRPRLGSHRIPGLRHRQSTSGRSAVPDLPRHRSAETAASDRSARPAASTTLEVSRYADLRSPLPRRLTRRTSYCGVCASSSAPSTRL